MLGTQLKIFLDITLPSKLFSKAISSKNKNSSLFVKKNILPILLLNIIIKKLSNFLFRLFHNYSKLKKIKT